MKKNEMDGEFMKKIFFDRVAYIHLNRLINLQNRRQTILKRSTRDQWIFNGA